jgi:hypothetical protein
MANCCRSKEEEVMVAYEGPDPTRKGELVGHEPEQFKAHRELFEDRQRMASFCRWMKMRFAPDTGGKPAKLLALSPKPKT